MDHTLIASTSSLTPSGLAHTDTHGRESGCAIVRGGCACEATRTHLIGCQSAFVVRQGGFPQPNPFFVVFRQTHFARARRGAGCVHGGKTSTGVSFPEVGITASSPWGVWSDKKQVTSVASLIANGPADQAALDQFQRNVAALSQVQGEIIGLTAEFLKGLSWMAGRDGALTAQNAAGLWVTGCSLPRRAAAAMLATMQSRGGTVCFLSPSHAAQLREALERLDASQAVLAILPDAQAAAFVLAGDDFTGDIHAGRLWLAVGEDWADQMKALLAKHEGLPLPSSFIRLPILPDNRAETLIQCAQKIFSEETTRRAARLAWLRSQPRQRSSTDSRRILLVAPMRFRLWDDAGWLMQQAMRQSADNAVTFVTMDPDDPRQASPLALANAALECDAILTANAYRSQMPNALPADLPWLTWVTTPRIAPPSPDAPADRLLLAEESLHEAALAAGWSVDRIRLATWPEAITASPASTDAPLVLINDTVPVDQPATPFELSSHQVLWDVIRDDIRRNPFCIGENLLGYLKSRITHLGLDESTVNMELFIDELIAPAFMQEIVKILLNNNLRLRIYGSGWDALPFAASACGGAVRTRERFEQIISGAGALLHPSPLRGAHLCHAYGRPVLHGLHTRPAELVAAARQILSPRRTVRLPSLSPLNAQRVTMLCFAP